MRKEYPWLNERDCPNELKILVADRISAYHRFITGHSELFNCTTVDQCAKVASNVVDDYLENRLIHAELKHYNDKKQILGQHPIFRLNKEREELLKLTGKELVRRRNAVYKSIITTRKALKERPNPKLDNARMERNEYNEKLLLIIDQHIDNLG